MNNPTSRWWAIASSMLALGGLALGTVACGDESATDPATTASGGGGGPTSGPAGPGAGGSTPEGCEPGETRLCEIPVGTQNGVLTCVAGQEVCAEGGTWGPCEGTMFARSAAGLPDGLRGDQLKDPLVVEQWLRAQHEAREAARGGGLFPGDEGGDTLRDHNDTQSDSEPCESPCDPACQAFPNPLDPEQPDGEITDPPGGASLGELMDELNTTNGDTGLGGKLFPDDGNCDIGEEQDCNVDSYCTGTAVPAASDGCAPWGPGEFDDELGGWDFTVGAGCGDVGSQLAPVCNRGDEAYEGPLTVWIFPATSAEISKCSIASNKDPEEACTFDVQLEPGECEIMPSICWEGVTGTNKALMVNPRKDGTDTGALAEPAAADCNNWGFWDKGAECETCTTSYEIELDLDNFVELGFGDFCDAHFLEAVPIAADERMILLQYRTDDDEPWESVTWVWYDRWDGSGDPDGVGCSGGEQALIWEHDFLGIDHYHMTLCDDLCDRAEDEADDGDDPAVRFTYDCPQTFEPTLTDSIVYQGVCPPATRTSWGYFGFNGVTPGDSTIDFRARTGSTDPPTGSFEDLVTAKDDSSGDDVPPACLFPDALDDVDADDDCPVDLWEQLDGAPDATQEFLEIEYTLNASSDTVVAPRLYEMYVTFTCPASE